MPINPDYFKVAGGTTHGGSSGFGRGDSIRRFANFRAALRSQWPPEPHLPEGKPQRRRPREKPVKTGNGGAVEETVRSSTSSGAERNPSTRTKRPADPMASAFTVERLERSTAPRHGKKRRSSQKRHEVEVRHRLEAKAERAEAPPAPVTQLRDRRHRPESALPTTLPPALHRWAESGREALRDAIHVATGLAILPLNVARVLMRLRKTGLPD